jgi:hypothetical protein
MAITSLISPSGYTSVQDDLWHIALSNNSGQTDMKYVFDVFKSGTQLVRVKVFPEPSNGRGYFNASNVIRNEVVFDWFKPVSPTFGFDMTLTQSDTLAELTYQIRVGEDFSGVTTLNMASGNVTAYNYTPPMLKRRQVGLGNKLNNWMSNRPFRIKAKTTDKILIPLFTDSFKWIQVYLYNENNAFVNGNTSNFVNPNVKKYVQLDVGATAIYNRSFLTIDNTIKYYTLQLLNASTEGLSTIKSPIIRVDIDCDPRYTCMNLYFINHYGMFDTARFNLAQKKMMSIDRKGFQQNEYKYNNTSVDYYDSNNVYSESKINFNTKTNWTYKLTMDYPTDAEYEWLSELMDSPQIYAEIDGNYYPVTIKGTNYEYMKYQNDGLKELVVEIEMNQTRYNFRR